MDQHASRRISIVDLGRATEFNHLLRKLDKDLVETPIQLSTEAELQRIQEHAAISAELNKSREEHEESWHSKEKEMDSICQRLERVRAADFEREQAERHQAFGSALQSWEEHSQKLVRDWSQFSLQHDEDCSQAWDLLRESLVQHADAALRTINDTFTANEQNYEEPALNVSQEDEVVQDIVQDETTHRTPENSLSEVHAQPHHLPNYMVDSGHLTSQPDLLSNGSHSVSSLRELPILLRPDAGRTQAGSTSGNTRSRCLLERSSRDFDSDAQSHMPTPRPATRHQTSGDTLLVEAPAPAPALPEPHDNAEAEEPWQLPSLQEARDAQSMVFTNAIIRLAAGHNTRCDSARYEETLRDEKFNEHRADDLHRREERENASLANESQREMAYEASELDYTHRYKEVYLSCERETLDIRQRLGKRLDSLKLEAHELFTLYMSRFKIAKEQWHQAHRAFIIPRLQSNPVLLNVSRAVVPQTRPPPSRTTSLRDNSSLSSLYEKVMALKQDASLSRLFEAVSDEGNTTTSAVGVDSSASQTDSSNTTTHMPTVLLPTIPLPESSSIGQLELQQVIPLADHNDHDQDRPLSDNAQSVQPTRRVVPLSRRPLAEPGSLSSLDLLQLPTGSAQFWTTNASLIASHSGTHNSSIHPAADVERKTKARTLPGTWPEICSEDMTVPSSPNRDEMPNYAQDIPTWSINVALSCLGLVVLSQLAWMHVLPALYLFCAQYLDQHWVAFWGRYHYSRKRDQWLNSLAENARGCTIALSAASSAYQRTFEELQIQRRADFESAEARREAAFWVQMSRHEQDEARRRDRHARVRLSNLEAFLERQGVRYESFMELDRDYGYATGYELRFEFWEWLDRFQASFEKMVQDELNAFNPPEGRRVNDVDKEDGATLAQVERGSRAEDE
ncbi:hypothetical protein H0H81_007076 [Sphagnurus paluster]|uniref:Uncharacterized protein n=1 Tax=Sphagnurus paluster TaxID=117069 RepID=A0A9P7GRW1_9AGAR|nr:hypothetical protein H0H81_007076 [Sphagnurus paluster]